MRNSNLTKTELSGGFSQHLICPYPHDFRKPGEKKTRLGQQAQGLIYLGSYGPLIHPSIYFIPHLLPQIIWGRYNKTKNYYFVTVRAQYLTLYNRFQIHTSQFHWLKFVPLYGRVIFYCIYVPQLHCPFICWWASRLPPVLTIPNSAVVNSGVHVSFSVLVYSGYMPNKSERKKQISHINAHIWNLGKWYWWTYLQGSSGNADIGNRLVDTVGEGEGGTNGESSMET